MIYASTARRCSVRLPTCARVCARRATGCRQDSGARRAPTTTFCRSRASWTAAAKLRGSGCISPRDAPQDTAPEARSHLRRHNSGWDSRSMHATRQDRPRRRRAGRVSAVYPRRCRGLGGQYWRGAIQRSVCVVDTGIVVTPDTVSRPYQGGLIFGLPQRYMGNSRFCQGSGCNKQSTTYRMPPAMDQSASQSRCISSSGEAPGRRPETGTTAAPPRVQ